MNTYPHPLVPHISRALCTNCHQHICLSEEPNYWYHTKDYDSRCNPRSLATTKAEPLIEQPQTRLI